MCRFENPISILGVDYCLIVPFDLEMSWCLLEKRWTGEGVDVELWFGGREHDWTCFGFELVQYSHGSIWVSMFDAGVTGGVVGDVDFWLR